LPQAQAAQQRLKDALVPPRSYAQRLEHAEDISPRGLLFHSIDKTGNNLLCTVVQLPRCFYPAAAASYRTTIKYL
jgi:hypothetical protein